MFSAVVIFKIKINPNSVFIKEASGFTATLFAFLFE